MSSAKPLEGVAILNTRPIELAKELTVAIKQAGGVSIECPAIQIIPKTINTLPSDIFDNVIFTSQFSLKYLPNVLIEHLKKTKSIFAIGHKTAAVVLDAGFSIKRHNDGFDSVSLLELPELQAIKNKKIAIVKGEGGRPLLAETLKQRQANISLINSYQRTCPLSLPIEIQNLWKNPHKILILGTSTESIDNLFTLFSERGQDWLKKMPWLVISRRVQEKAVSRGVQEILLSNPPSLLNDILQIKNRIPL